MSAVKEQSDQAIEVAIVAISQRVDAYIATQMASNAITYISQLRQALEINGRQPTKKEQQTIDCMHDFLIGLYAMDGSAVVTVRGKAGCVSIEHLTPINT